MKNARLLVFLYLGLSCLVRCAPEAGDDAPRGVFGIGGSVDAGAADAEAGIGGSKSSSSSSESGGTTAAGGAAGAYDAAAAAETGGSGGSGFVDAASADASSRSEAGAAGGADGGAAGRAGSGGRVGAGGAAGRGGTMATGGNRAAGGSFGLGGFYAVYDAGCPYWVRPNDACYARNQECPGIRGERCTCRITGMAGVWSCVLDGGMDTRDAGANRDGSGPADAGVADASRRF